MLCIRLGLNQRRLFQETDYESGAFDHSATDALFGAGGI